MHLYKITVFNKLLFSKNNICIDNNNGFVKDIKVECKFSIDNFYNDLERINVT